MSGSGGPGQTVGDGRPQSRSPSSDGGGGQAPGAAAVANTQVGEDGSGDEDSWEPFVVVGERTPVSEDDGEGSWEQYVVVGERAAPPDSADSTAAASRAASSARVERAEEVAHRADAVFLVRREVEAAGTAEATGAHAGATGAVEAAEAVREAGAAVDPEVNPEAVLPLISLEPVTDYTAAAASRVMESRARAAAGGDPEAPLRPPPGDSDSDDDEVEVDARRVVEKRLLRLTDTKRNR
ncbi:hypothetical protein ONE63_004002 [Megalurothrips usitatus]|uniref:Uncharacterized protein n=1 Tax=Megalurothrips usitatus TaxID=439358 RepID=A0AAV7X8F3_9NEOP|nr:hypothetical protein ONE63_004002 [Megalurothrips usitatus]